jgi:Yip1 domain
LFHFARATLAPRRPAIYNVAGPDRVETGGGNVDIVERAKAMVIAPAAEWRTIEPESGDAAYLFANYAAALAAIAPLCILLRHMLFAVRGPRFGLHAAHRFGFFSSLFGAVVHWAAALAVVYAIAVVIDGLAPTFSAQKNQENALKLAVYSMTPVWLGGVFALIPGLGFLRIVALLYGVYVFWLGLPVLMKPPADRSGPYAVATVVCGIILAMIVAAVVGPAT